MTKTATADLVLSHVRQSGLIAVAQLDMFLADNPALEAGPALLAGLVAAGLLTRYQADKIAAGRYKGFVLGPYTVLDRIGGGGIGHVFLAEHSSMRRLVALKVLSIDSAKDAVTRERFFREARAAAGLDHPNIIRAFDLRYENAVFYFVMEYVDGDSLQHVVSRHSPLDGKTAAHYGRQVALGLQHAHEFGLVHRDIKPANLHLGRDGTVKILDLGLVRSVEDTDSKLTEKFGDSILGTTDYLAPEQAVNSSSVDIRADIYSLGATLYFLLTGRTLFIGAKAAQKLMWHQMKEPTPLRELVPAVPEGLAAIIHRCLAKNPNDRFTEPVDLANALDEFACGPPPIPPAEVMPPPLPRRAWASRLPILDGGPPSGLSLPSLPMLEDVGPVTMPPRSVTRGSHLFLPPAAGVATLSDVASITPREQSAVPPSEMSRRWPVVAAVVIGLSAVVIVARMLQTAPF